MINNKKDEFMLATEPRVSEMLVEDQKKAQFNETAQVLKELKIDEKQLKKAQMQMSLKLVLDQGPATAGNFKQ